MFENHQTGVTPSSIIMIPTFAMSSIHLLLCIILACTIVSTSGQQLYPNVTTGFLPSIPRLLSSVPKIKDLEIVQNFISPQSKLIQFLDNFVDSFFSHPPLPHVNDDTWWGHGEPNDENNYIRPYKVQFNPENVKRLIHKLKNRENCTEPLHKAAFTYGMNCYLLNHVMEYWRKQYNFQARQERINEYPQYITNIQGLDIHYYHIKPEGKYRRTVPLLMIHGAPTSNLEYLMMYRQLISGKKGYDFVFEIIAPTIPGHGYSQGTSKIGLAPYQIAVILKNLMTRIGFKKFYIHAGDFGQVIATDMSTQFEEDILGFHTNFPFSLRVKTLAKYAFGAMFPPAVVEPRYADRLYPIFNRIYYYLRYFGYFHIQGAKPDSLDAALQDSPAGLASWYLTTMSWVANPYNDFLEDGGLLKTYNIDDLLDILTVAWDTKSATTSMRLYAEYTAIFQDPKLLAFLEHPTKVPYACIKFRHEVIYQPDGFLRDKYPNLVRSTTLDYGGHFAPLEYPDVLADDIWQGVKAMMAHHRNNLTFQQPD